MQTACMMQTGHIVTLVIGTRVSVAKTPPTVPNVSRPTVVLVETSGPEIVLG